MYYRRKLDSSNTLIKIVIEPNNKYCELTIQIWYNKVNSKVKLYIKIINNYNK